MKIKTSLLLSSVTLEVNDEIGTNVESSRLKDCPLWEKCENVICGAISVSTYGLFELPSI